jgi:hypothetical protein
MRVLHQVLDYLKDKNPETVEWKEIYDEYMPAWSDPNHLLRFGRQYHE